jgi:hypothetical protein
MCIRDRVFIFNLQGKLIQKLDPQLLVTHSVSFDKIARKTGQGILVIKQKGAKPITYMAGLR